MTKRNNALSCSCVLFFFFDIQRVRHHLINCEYYRRRALNGKEQAMNEETMKTGAEGVEEAQAAGAEEQAGGQGEKGAEGQEQPEKKYTDADVDRIIAKKIAAERKRMQKLFEGEQQENEMEKRERDVTRRELMADAKDRLINEGFPSSLAGIMDYTDNDSFEQSYQNVTAVFKEAMGLEFKRRFSGQTPKANRGSREIDQDKALANAFAPPKR